MARYFDDKGNEIDFSACPYYRGEGTCENGCIDEPSCFTDRPRDGWPSERSAGHNQVGEVG